MAAKKRKRRSEFSTINPNAAGIDIGSTFHVVAVPTDRDENPVQTFQSFTGELYKLADWLESCKIDTVAMESTGIYWMPLYEILIARGIRVVVSNARDVKNVPGRKTDVNDAQWLRQLHEVGLLRGSFHPSEDFSSLRSYIRQRERLLDYSASHIQHIQKALMLMNVQLHHVVSDITGKTGMRIIHAILAGERDPHVLAQMKDVRCKAPVETIAAALEGNYTEEHLFALRQVVSLYKTYQTHITDCDRELEIVLNRLRLDEPPHEPLPKARHRTKQPNQPEFNVREVLYAVTGVDLTQIHGIGPYLALKLVGECGTDMSKWKTAKHFTSWLCLAPGNKISGGKILSSHTRRSKNRVTALLRLAAVNVGKTDSALGAYYRRLSARIGKAKAVTATARKLATLFYNTLRYGRSYSDPGASHYETTHRARTLKSLKRRAEQMGFKLEPATGECVS